MKWVILTNSPKWLKIVNILYETNNNSTFVYMTICRRNKTQTRFIINNKAHLSNSHLADDCSTFHHIQTLGHAVGHRVCNSLAVQCVYSIRIAIVALGDT